MGLCTAAALAVLWIAGGAAGQDLAEFEKRMTEFTLDNGIRFLVLERRGAPVVTCYTYADVGAADAGRGRTGMAHLFEHMAFKGTKTIGTRDYDAEVKRMAETDKWWEAVECRRETDAEAEDQSLAELRKRCQEAQRAEQELIVPGEFEETLKRAGGIALNARTNYDSTVYFVSLPSNKLELWALLESGRFLFPVLRGFYSERDMVMQERRQRVENNPVGLLGEEFLATAYRRHPYGEPTIGSMSDLQSITRAEARTFFEEYYGPGNLTMAVVGDVDLRWAKELAQDYFGRIPKRSLPKPAKAQEPPQLGERRILIELPVQPIVLIGYHKPEFNHPDDVVFDVITDILGSGRTARLYTSLVRDQGIALSAACFSGTPGKKCPGLYVFHAVPAKGHTNQECERAIYGEIDRLMRESVSPAELQKARTRARAALIRSLASNEGLAAQLSFFHVVTGDWRNFFRRLDRLAEVEAADIQRVAGAYLTSKNRTVGMIEMVSARE
jgi:predicted Zn-dependent peptidase